VLEVARSMHVRALLFAFMEIDEGHSEYLYKVMTTNMQRRENLDCKGWDTILSAAHLSIVLGLFGGI
jgi:hypothetical protein